MPIQYLKKSPKTSSTDDGKTREIVKRVRSIFSWPHSNALSQCTMKTYFINAIQKEFMKMIWIQKIIMKDAMWHSHSPVYIDKFGT